MTQGTLVPVGANPLAPTDPSIVAAAEAAKALVLARFQVAAFKPRSEDQARARILAACKRPTFAERASYRKKVGRKKEKGRWVDNFVTGPSIRFAELAIREWGNIHVEAATVYEDADRRRIRIDITDLETNATHTSEITVTKTVERKDSKGRDVVGERTNSYGDPVFIVRATDEEVDTKAQAAISKVKRNEGLRLIPSDIVDDGMAEARRTLANEAAEDPAAAKKKMVDGFATVGVMPRDLEQYLGHKLDTISPHEIVDLRQVYTDIRDGGTTWSAIMNPDSEIDLADAVEDAEQAVADLAEEIGSET